MLNRSLKTHLILLFLFLPPILACSQESFIPIYPGPVKSFDSLYDKKGANFHSAIKPFQLKDLKLLTDSIYNFSGHSVLNKKKLKISLCPLLNITGLYQTGSDNFFSMREAGAMVNMEVGKRIGVYGDFTAGNSYFPDYLDSFISRYEIIPGFGNAYKNGRNYNYQMSNFYLTASPSRFFNLTAGHGKNFIGDGYRSLFLSDQSAPSPYFRILATAGQFKYIALFSALKDINTYPFIKGDRHLKFSAIHYLSWNIGKRITLGFFESIIWQSRDTTGKYGMEINYLNPVVFYRPVEFSIGSSDNALVGGGFKIRLFNNQAIYGQIILDEFLLSEIKNQTGWWANKYGFQFGANINSPFNLKGLYIKAEFNYVRPFTYSHGNPIQNYGHFNQPLAHPFGANFMEQVYKFAYRKNKYGLEFSYIYAIRGLDYDQYNYGQDIYKSYTTHSKELGNYTGQGLVLNYHFFEPKVYWNILPVYNLRVEAGIAGRVNKTVRGGDNKNFIVVGIKSGFNRFYSDL